MTRDRDEDEATSAFEIRLVRERNSAIEQSARLITRNAALIEQISALKKQPKITKLVLIISQNGADNLILHFDIPTGCLPEDDFATATMHIRRLHGAEYAAKHFPGIKLETIDCRHG